MLTHLEYLSNGIPVVMHEMEGHVGSFYWWNKTGSVHESTKEAGFAHFLEHMLFKDTTAKETGKASTGQIARSIESLGGEINAYTSFEQTVYHVTCAENHWERVIKTFSSMARPTKFLKEDFEREREVILEELKRSQDNPGRQLFQRLFKSSYPSHAYGRPVIGNAPNLKRAKVQELERFYRSRYVPGLMGLILVGPLSDEKRRKSILKLLEHAYGKKVFKEREPKSVPRKSDPIFRGSPKWESFEFDVQTPSVMLAFRVPELQDEAIPALDLLSSILGMGELSRFYQKLFYEKKLVTDISAGLYVPHDSGLLYVQCDLEKVSDAETVLDAIFTELARIRDQGVTAEELTRVLVSAESERLYSTQTTDGMASRLGFLKFVIGDLDFDRRYLDVLRSVKNEDIQKVASEYLTPENLSGVLMSPKEQKCELSTSKFTSVVKSHLKKASVKSPQPKTPLYNFIEHKTKSGIRVVHYPRASSHVFSIHASVLGGLRLELGRPLFSREEDWGMSHLLAMTWTKGTKEKSARQVSEIVEGSAASVDGFSGRNSIGLDMTGLGRDWKKLSTLFSEILVTPNFGEEEVDHSKRVVEESLKNFENHSSQVCTKLFIQTLFDRHPYGQVTMGSLETLPFLTPERLRAYHRAWVRPERLSIAISGPVTEKQIEEFLEDLDARFADHPEGHVKLIEEVSEDPLIRAPRWIDRQFGREQTHILVGGNGITLKSPDRYAIRVLQTILGGQSGRLFIELREKKSLAYTVAPVGFEGIEPGFLAGYIACSPSKVKEALEGFEAVYQKLAEKGPSEKEMNRAREFYLGRKAMDLQSDPSIAAHYGLLNLYGLPLDEDAQIRKKLSKISAKDIKRVCQKYFVEPPRVTSQVG